MNAHTSYEIIIFANIFLASISIWISIITMGESEKRWKESGDESKNKKKKKRKKKMLN